MDDYFGNRLVLSATAASRFSGSGLFRFRRNVVGRVRLFGWDTGNCIHPLPGLPRERLTRDYRKKETRQNQQNETNPVNPVNPVKKTISNNVHCKQFPFPTTLSGTAERSGKEITRKW